MSSLFSTNYSTLEDAWNMDLTGGAMNLKKTKKSKKSSSSSAQVKDPICDLYEQGAAGAQYAGSPNNAYSEEDLIEYVNNVHAAPYNKNEFQKPMPESRQENPQVVVDQSDKIADVPAAKDDQEDMHDFMNYLEKTTESSKGNISNAALFDVGVYILSGVILIFILEQFVKIGMMMRL